MKKYLFTKVGPRKVKAIAVVRKATGLGLKEAKDIVDAVELGTPCLLDINSALNINDIISEFNELGATLIIDNENDFWLDEEKGTETIIDEKNINYDDKRLETELGNNYKSENKQYVPPIVDNKVHKLDREGTLVVLKEAAKIAFDYEKVENDISTLVMQKEAEIDKAESLRKVVSSKAKILRWAVTLIAFFAGMVGTVLCVVTGILAWVIMTMTVIKWDRRKHQDENNTNADNYLQEHVVPIQKQLDALYVKRDDFNYSGKCNWVKSVVGRDLFYSECIKDLYELVQNHRADSIKEALNQYDNAKYKARMEEMQAAIQNASEITAAEAVKQTVYSQEIAKNSKQAANATKAIAAHTRSIDRNTRRFR